MATPIELKPWQAIALVGVIIAVLGAAVLAYLNIQPDDQASSDNNISNQPTSTPTPTATLSPTPQITINPSPTPGATAVSQNLVMYMVALEEGSGQNSFGCGDRLQSVQQTLTTASPLRDIMSRLLAYPNQYYGESGLYNALHTSNLQVESVNLANGRADIRLTGTLAQHGACDAPRIEEQLKSTAMQFGSVTSVNITINGQTLDQALNHH